MCTSGKISDCSSSIGSSIGFLLRLIIFAIFFNSCLSTFNFVQEFNSILLLNLEIFQILILKKLTDNKFKYNIFNMGNLKLIITKLF